MKPTIEEEGKEGDEPKIEEVVDVPVPLFQEQTAEVIKVILQQRVSVRIVEQIVAAVPQIMEGGPQLSGGLAAVAGFFSAALTPFFALLQVV